MATREEKLAAARKKLREFQCKTRGIEPKSLSRKSSVASSPSPGLSHPAGVNESRPDSPIDAARLAWERRQTIVVDEVQPQETGAINEVAIPLGSDDKDHILSLELQCNALKEQLQRQGQVISVLVSERNDAQTSLSRVQSELQQNSDSLDDLKNKYLEATRRIHEFENSRPLNLSPSKVEELSASHQRIAILEEQLSEITSRFNAKNAECDALTQKVLNLGNSLSVSQVKIQQLTIDDGSVINERQKKLEEDYEALRKENDLLKRRLQAAAMEGEQASHRFHVYAEQCNAQHISLRRELRDAIKEATEMREQNETLQFQFNTLQSQFNEKQQQEHPLVSRIDELCKETAMLARSLQDKDCQISDLEQKLKSSVDAFTIVNEDLEAARSYIKRVEAKADNGRPDPALLAAMESDKVAASRAVAQNQKLKEQITELQDAFIRVSDEKLNLLEKLSKTEHENAELQQKIIPHEKHDNCDHDHDDDDDDEDDEDENIETLRRIVHVLRRDKTELIHRLQQMQNGHHHYHHQEHEHDHDHGDDSKEEAVLVKDVNVELVQLQRAVKQLQEDKAELLNRFGVPNDDPEVQGLLQKKLTKSMNEIAKLDEEKERLEHLVLQLQGETETIGEYITLYHKQRLLLKQRSVEKDEQLHQLSKDREDLKQKLDSLNELVAKLVEERDQGLGALKVPEASEEGTAEKIKALITEIGNNNVVNSHSVAFEQCSCCSGRLITV